MPFLYCKEFVKILIVYSKLYLHRVRLSWTTVINFNVLEASN